MKVVLVIFVDYVSVKCVGEMCRWFVGIFVDEYCELLVGEFVLIGGIYCVLISH